MGRCCLGQFSLHAYDPFRHAETGTVLRPRAAIQSGKITFQHLLRKGYVDCIRSESGLDAPEAARLSLCTSFNPPEAILDAPTVADLLLVHSS